MPVIERVKTCSKWRCIRRNDDDTCPLSECKPLFQQVGPAFYSYDECEQQEHYWKDENTGTDLEEGG